MAGRESAEYQLWWESHCNGRSKQTINWWESCPKQQNRFQTNLSSTFWNLRRHRGWNFLSRLVVSDKVSACGRESRSDCPGVGYPVFYSFVAQLKSWTWRPYSTNPTKKTFKWEFGKKSGGTLWTLLAPQIQDYPIKKICRGEHENDSSKRSCETPVFELKTLDQWIIPAILEKRLCSLSWKKIRASLNLLRQRRGLKLKNWISKKIFPQLIKFL